MELPAVTLCLDRMEYSDSFRKDLATYATLKKFLVNCSIGGTECDYDNFYSFETQTNYNSDIILCHVLNGGRNSSGHHNEIKSIRRSICKTDHVWNQQVFFSKYNKRLEKIVETKLEYPFDNCWNLINIPDTPFVRQISAANITYRQVNWFELCFENNVQKYALEHNISEDEAREKEEVKNYDREKNCKNLCPLECESSQYKMLQSMLILTEYSEYS